MPVMTRNMVDLEDEILTKIDEKFSDFKTAIMIEIREQIKQEVSVALEKEIKKREELTVCMLPEHVKNYQEQKNELKASQDELEQYGRRLCIRILVYQWLKMRHQTMFYKMLDQLLKNLAVKYLMLQSTEPIELAMHTLIKHLG